MARNVSRTTRLVYLSFRLMPVFMTRVLFFLEDDISDDETDNDNNDDETLNGRQELKSARDDPQMRHDDMSLALWSFRTRHSKNTVTDVYTIDGHDRNGFDQSTRTMVALRWGTRLIQVSCRWQCESSDHITP